MTMSFFNLTKASQSLYSPPSKTAGEVLELLNILPRRRKPDLAYTLGALAPPDQSLRSLYNLVSFDTQLSNLLIMATSKEKKQEQLKALEDKFSKAAGAAFVKFDGPTVNEVQQVRRDLRANGMTYTVIKKTLIQLAAKNTKLAEFEVKDLDGVVAVITSETDAIAPAAAIKTLKKEFTDKETKETKFDFSGAVFEGKFLDPAATASWPIHQAKKNPSPNLSLLCEKDHKVFIQLSLIHI